jgi:two-component sensor histidine kinase
MLNEIRNRVHSMALLHETFYGSDTPAIVDFSAYVERLLDHLYQYYGVRRDAIRFNVTLHHLCLNMDAALACGLIVNEVVSNSLKHAFPGGRKGEVRIVLEERPRGTFSLIIADDGIGIVQDTDPATTKSLGLRLVNLLARQLDAKLEIHSRNGTEFRLTFTLDPERQNEAAITDERVRT